MRIHRLFSVGLLCAMAISVQADDRDVYSWTDSEGNVHFSDRPMTDKAARLDITSKATDNERIAEQRQARAVNSQAKPVAGVAGEEKAQSAPEDPDKAAARYAENCKRAQAALQSINNARRLYVPTDDGSRRYLGKDETTQRRAKAQADVAEWCR